MMIREYNEFILERRVEMIAESIVVYSDRLKELLRRVDTPVSKRILDMEGKDHDVASNYLDIAEDTPEQVSFTPDKKVEALRKKVEGVMEFTGGSCLQPDIPRHREVLGELGIDPATLSTGEPALGDTCKVLSSHDWAGNIRVWAVCDFSGERKVVPLSSIRQTDPEKAMFVMGRQEVRVGKLLRAMAKASGEKFTDAEIEETVNKYKAAWDRRRDAFRNFEVVQGDDIAYWYNRENYVPSVRTTLANSCMRAKPSWVFTIYTANPEVCSLVILKSEEDPTKIEGRALLWRTDQGFTFMDRAYYTKESHVELFRQYAHKNGWYHKSRNDSDHNESAIGPNGEREYEINVTVKDAQLSHFPYMDTIKFLVGNRLTNDEESHWDKMLDSTGGGFTLRCEYCENSGRVTCSECDGDGRMECEYCGGSGREECPDCEGYGKEECPDCDGHGKIECDTCSGDGDHECDDCEGTGKNSEGEECVSCSGNGSLECLDCDGKGSNECHKCDGDGEIDCSNCGGDGDMECSNCDGRGRAQCSYCDGDGERDCPECS